MIKGTGVDIVEIDRIRSAVTKYGKKFLSRIFTPHEIKYCTAFNKLKYPELSVRFAAKEAVFKALSQPGHYLSWQNVEILSAEDGRPMLILSGEALKRAEERGFKSLEISLSHSRENAVAVVMGFSE